MFQCYYGIIGQLGPPVHVTVVVVVVVSGSSSVVIALKAHVAINYLLNWEQ